MEIVLIRHGQPAWIVEDEYRRNPGLTELGKVQSQKSASVFLENINLISFALTTHPEKQ